MKARAVAVHDPMVGHHLLAPSHNLSVFFEDLAFSPCPGKGGHKYSAKRINEPKPEKEAI